MSRFECASASLSLKLLLRRMRRVIWVGLAGSIAIHFSFTAWSGLAKEEQMVKPLTTQFIKRRPRLTKPLELKKRPRPKRRHIQRKMVSVKARTDRREISSRVRPMHVVESLARPQVDITRISGLQDIGLEPAAIAESVQGTKDAKQALDAALEMMDLDALDTGKYHAMVIQDPSDKRNIRGFFHLAIVHIQSLARTARGNVNRADAGVAKLIQAVNEVTDIRADIRYRISLDSPDLFKTPWIYAGTSRRVELTDGELCNLGKYLAHGGFLYGEEWVGVAHNSFEGSEKAFTYMYREALATQGYLLERDWAFEQLPSRHPVFHCFFDFDNIPVGYMGSYLTKYPKYLQSGLMGVILGRRLLGTYSHRCHVASWYGKGWSGPDTTEQMPQQRRALQFGINAIVFALTQEGSITHRVMEEVH